MSAQWCPAVRLIEAVGEQAAQALLREYGGRQIYVRQPKSKPRQDIVELIGSEAAAALSRAFGGSDILIPTSAIRPKTAKDKLVPLLEGGATPQEAAAEVGCTLRFAQVVRADLGLAGPATPRKKPKPARTLITDMIRAGRGDREIARACSTTPAFVQGVRQEIQTEARA